MFNAGNKFNSRTSSLLDFKDAMISNSSLMSIFEYSGFKSNTIQEFAISKLILFSFPSTRSKTKP